MAEDMTRFLVRRSQTTSRLRLSARRSDGGGFSARENGPVRRATKNPLAEAIAEPRAAISSSASSSAISPASICASRASASPVAPAKEVSRQAPARSASPGRVMRSLHRRDRLYRSFAVLFHRDAVTRNSHHLHRFELLAGSQGDHLRPLVLPDKLTV